MNTEKNIYWLLQVSGWLGFITLILIQNLMLDNVTWGIVKVLALNFFLGIFLSHLMRTIWVEGNFLKRKIRQNIPLIILFSLMFGFLAAAGYAVVSDFFFTDVQSFISNPFSLILELIFPYTLVFLFWNILYIAAIFLKNYEKEEIKNLRLTSALNEAELHHLKSQLNPHFMFNAMNSIRALIDENPVLAKKSITQLSSLLRNTLAVGRKKFLPLSQELKVVLDYLQLEKIRYESRLNFDIDYPADLADIEVPALLLQTLVENGIKHGISTLPEGGVLKISAERTADGHWCLLRIINSGSLNNAEKPDSEGMGIGLDNTKKRLKLCYDYQAKIDIYNRENTVVCEVYIPLKTTLIKNYEHTDH